MNKILLTAVLSMFVASSAFATSTTVVAPVTSKPAVVEPVKAATPLAAETKVAPSVEKAAPVAEKAVAKPCECKKPVKKARKKFKKVVEEPVAQIEAPKPVQKKVVYGYPVAYNIYGYKIPVSYTYPDVTRRK